MEEEQEKLFNRINLPKPDRGRIIPITVGLVIIIIVIVIIISVKYFIESSAAKVDLLYAPTSAVATIDGRTYASGEITLSAGSHEITVQKYGFTTETQTITAKSGETVKAYFVLEPNESITSDWYYTHSEDARISEKINGFKFNDSMDQTKKEDPTITKLPITKDIFKIYSGLCDGDKKCIIIDAKGDNRNQAIDYFRENIDSDIGNYYITFKDYYNPFIGEG